jgi:hypothetical protein
MTIDWNATAAIASMIAAIAAAATAVIALFQTKQASKVAVTTANQAMELAKFNAEFQSVQHLDGEWQSQRMVAIRRSAAKALLQGKPNSDVDQILDFFEEIARLKMRGILPIETAWHAYYWQIACYWAMSAAYVEQVQKDEGPTWESLSDMIGAMREVQVKESHRPMNEIAPSKEQTREFLTDESNLTFSQS